MLEFLAGKQIRIKDMFHLGQFRKPQPSALPPCPIFLKLSTAWDRKLGHSRRVKLNEFHIRHLFLQEDVAPDHRLHCRPSGLPSDKAKISSSGPIPLISKSVAASPAPLLPHSGASGGSKIHPSLLPTPLSRSVSPVASSQCLLLLPLNQFYHLLPLLLLPPPLLLQLLRILMGLTIMPLTQR